MIVAEARTTAAAARVAAAAAATTAAKVAAAKAAAAAAADAEATNETALPAQTPASWAFVEPWSSLLLGEHGRGGEDEHEVQDRKLAEVRLGDGEPGRAIVQDAARTRSDTAAFRDPNVRHWLERSVSLFCRERGLHYTQGLTELAAPWALITEPPCLSGFSYRCFCSFMERFAPNIFATAPDDGAAGKAQEAGQQRGAFVVLEAHLVLLEQLLRFHDPALAVHLDRCCEGPAAYATSWFVTLFARQMPVPALLHLWQRLAERGDPVLVQFFALAWLVGNRDILLSTPREDVLKTVTRLRLASADVVDRVLGDALALRESTPRLFCDLVSRACYSGGGTNAQGEPAARTAAAADSAAGFTVDSPVGGKPGPVHAATKTTRLRVGLLGFLRATGVLTVDADQVAEILLAQPSASVAAAAVADPTDEEDGRCTDAAPRICGRFILVDCRPPHEQEKGGGRGAASLSSCRASVVREGFGAGGRHVIWRRINPAESFAKQVGAVSELLRESCGGGEGGGGGEAEQPAPPLEALGSGIDGAPGGEGVFEEIALEHEVDGDGSNSKCAVETLTHVCFIGIGGLRDSSGGGDSSFASPAEAEARAAAPEFRLARVASLTCLTPHVCVLEGGFSALDQAFDRKGFEDSLEDASSARVGDEKEPSAGAGHPPFAVGQESIDRPNGEVVAATRGSGGRDEARDGPMRPDAAGEEGYLRADTTKTMPTTPAEGSSPNPASPSGGGGGGDPVPLSSFSRGLERKASRLAGNRRISEPFRVYAAKSADDMASGLRSLPLGASKSLEDAARVCNSLAKTNVRALGDSRLSLSRSVSRLEQLNARMDGTARGFARHFGAGWLRGDVIDVSQVQDS